MHSDQQGVGDEPGFAGEIRRPLSKMALEVVFSGFELAKTRTGCANRNGVAKTLKATRTARGSISLMPTAEDAEEDPLLVAPEAHAAQDRRWERKYNSAALVFSP